MISSAIDISFSNYTTPPDLPLSSMSLSKDVYPKPDLFCLHFQIVVVFYVAIVLLLIGTNLRAGRMTRSARFKHHVVEFNEASGAANRLVPSRSTSSSSGGLGGHHSSSGGAGGGGGSALIGIDQDDDVAEV